MTFSPHCPKSDYSAFLKLDINRHILLYNRYYIGKKMKEVCVALAPFLEIGVWHCFAMPYSIIASYSYPHTSSFWAEGGQRAHTPHLFRWLWFSRTSSMDDGSLRNHFWTGWTKLSVELTCSRHFNGCTNLIKFIPLSIISIHFPFISNIIITDAIANVNRWRFKVMRTKGFNYSDVDWCHKRPLRFMVKWCENRHPPWN